MAIHGKNTVVKIGNYPETLTDVSDSIDNEDLSLQADTAETTTMSSDTIKAKTHIPGLKDGSFSLSIVWNPTIDRHMDLIVGRKRAFEIGPEGSASGKVKYSGNAICTGYSGSSPVGDKIPATAEFQIDDEVPRGTWA